MKHWILTRDTAQAITECLDQNKCSLKYAKTYYSAYGVEIKGRTKQQFIKNLWVEVNKP